MMSPLAFLSRPERWLWALSDSGGALCPAPILLMSFARAR